MASNINIQVIIQAIDKATAPLRQMGNNLNQTSKGISSSFGGISRAAGMLGIVLGAAGLVGAIKGCIDASQEQQRVLAQLDAVLASTGGVAGVTRDQVISLAKGFQNTTTYSDEAVISAENILLTFNKITKNTFPQATQAVLDISTALGQDLQGSAIQVGKALQDPILGLTALRRVGVYFNETSREMIKKLVETGHVMEAQKYILKELTNEFGGSAEAMARTFGGRMTQMRNKIDDLAEVIGDILIPGIETLVEVFSSMLPSSMDSTGSSMMRLKVISVGIGAAFAFMANVVIGAVKIIIGAIQSIFSLSVKPLYNAIKSVAVDTLVIYATTEDKIKALAKQSVSKQVSTVRGGMKQMEDASSQKTAKIAKDLEEETRKYEEATAKRVANFKERLADLIWAHIDKKNSLEKDISEENADFNTKMDERKQSFADDMVEMQQSHQEKVDAIKAQLTEEQAKGAEADQARILSLQAELAQEDAQYLAQQAKETARQAAEDARLQAEHAKKLADLQTELNAENEILKKHQEDVAVVKEQAREDDITRLKRQYEEENTAAKAEHERRMKEVAEQGTAEGDAYGGGISSGLTGPLEDIENKMTETGKTAGENFTKGISDQARKAGEAMIDKFIDGIIKNARSAIDWLRKFGLLGSPLLSPVVDLGKMLIEKGIEHKQGGGIVPGEIGEAVPIIAHGQERVIPAGISTPSQPSHGGGVILNVSIGLYAGTEVEKRNIAKDLYASLVQVAQSQNKNVKELMGG